MTGPTIYRKDSKSVFGCAFCPRRCTVVTVIHNPHKGVEVFVCARCVAEAYKVTWGQDS